jgi:hypothetical protein
MKWSFGNTLAAFLGLIAGILEYLNQQTFDLGVHWHPVVTYGILLITLVGVTPIVGANIGLEIRTLTHMTSAVFVLICAALYALAAAVTTFSIDGMAKAIILGVVAFAGAIGFSPTSMILPATVERQRLAARSSE